MASTSAAAEQSTQSPDASHIHVKIMSPSLGVPADLAYHLAPATTINALKSMIKDSLESKPSPAQQKLIYRGKILEGASVIGDALIGSQEAHTLHLVLSPPQASPAAPATNLPAPFLFTSQPTGSTTAFRPEFPRYDRTTTTTTTTRTTTSNVTSSSNGNLSNGLGSGVTAGPTNVERLHQELRIQREILEGLRRGHLGPFDLTDNGYGTSSGVSFGGINSGVRARGTLSSSPGSSSGGIASSSLGGGSTSAATLPQPILPTPEQSIAQNLEYMDALRRDQDSARVSIFPHSDEVAARRRALQDSLREMEQEETGLFPPEGPSRYALDPQPYTFTQQVIPENSLVYLLQDQFGRPHSLLVGPPGSALQAPQAYAPGYQYAQHLNGPYRVPQAPQAAQPLGAPYDQANLDQRRQQVEVELDLIRQRLENVRQFDFPRMVRDRAAHLWLALKLTVFVVLFTGNGGWSRILYLGSIAVAIFIWQSGLMNQLFRPLLDAINPPPPPGYVAPPPPPLNAETTRNQEAPLDPARTAQMLVNRREDRMRDMIRNAERAFMIFMASLIPGWHDRHVNAIERQQQQQPEAQADEPEPQPAEARDVEVVEGVL